MVDVSTAWRIHTSDCASIDISLNARAVVCDGHEEAALVPAEHRLLLQVSCRVPKPPARKIPKGVMS